MPSLKLQKNPQGGFGLTGEMFDLLLLGYKLGLDHPKWVERPKTPRKITEVVSQSIIVMHL